MKYKNSGCSDFKKNSAHYIFSRTVDALFSRKVITHSSKAFFVIAHSSEDILDNLAYLVMSDQSRNSSAEMNM